MHNAKSLSSKVLPMRIPNGGAGETRVHCTHAKRKQSQLCSPFPTAHNKNA